MNHRLIACLMIAGLPGSLVAQGTLDRSPDVSGDWVAGPGTVQFNFLHRFVRSPKPVRKVSNFPTFLLAASFLKGTTIGFNYATNSTLAPAYPNEWEFFARTRPLTQARGFPVDVAGQVGYNLAARGVDGEFSLGRRAGPLGLTAVVRILSDPDPGQSDLDPALGGGAVLKLTRHLALQGDYVRLTQLARASGERAAWSAGLAVAIPNTPHTISLHATNSNTGTLQGATRGGARVRYGFEFTIPITLARYFGHRPKPPVATPPPQPDAPPAGFVPMDSIAGPMVRTGITAIKFDDETIEIPVGTTVEWKNGDQLPHTVTADYNAFDSGTLERGQVWRFTFTQPGSYAFHCTLHPFMKGTIVVK